MRVTPTRCQEWPKWWICSNSWIHPNLMTLWNRCPIWWYQICQNSTKSISRNTQIIKRLNNFCRVSIRTWECSLVSNAISERKNTILLILWRDGDQHHLFNKKNSWNLLKIRRLEIFLKSVSHCLLVWLVQKTKMVICCKNNNTPINVLEMLKLSQWSFNQVRSM